MFWYATLPAELLAAAISFVTLVVKSATFKRELSAIKVFTPISYVVLSAGFRVSVDLVVFTVPSAV